MRSLVEIEPLDELSRDIAEVAAVEVITTVASTLRSCGEMWPL